MAIFRGRNRTRMKTVVAVAMTGLVILLLQRYALNSQTSLHSDKDRVHRKLQELRGTGSMRNSSTSATTLNGAPLLVKTILMHTFPDYYELKSGPGVFLSCDFPCTLTLDAELLEEVDSVVIYYHGFRSPLLRQRSADQVWVFFAVESPSNSRNVLFQTPQGRGLFNWTMTYRRDSDFYFGYGDVVRARASMPARDLSTVVAGKSKLAAWFVSNCHTQSKREEFAEALMQFMKVDVYGQCGSLTCTKNSHTECMNMLSRDYYFYLAFENSLCADYLTEKVYRTMKMIDVVPVVRGGANYTAVLPAHSFIDASDFPSVKALTDYLKWVAGNRERYQSYLTWKHEWRVIEPSPFPFCEFCRRLHHKKRWARVYPDIDAWWVEGQCRPPPAVGIKS